MSAAGKGAARVGAAVFALGLCLAGPGVVSASADTGDGVLSIIEPPLHTPARLAHNCGGHPWPSSPQLDRERLVFESLEPGDDVVG